MELCKHHSWVPLQFCQRVLLEQSGEHSSLVRLSSHKLAQVSLSRKPLVKVKHGDLMAASNGFSSENVIFYTRTSQTYKALLLDGSALAVKHLSTCNLGENKFWYETNQLWDLRYLT